MGTPALLRGTTDPLRRSSGGAPPGSVRTAVHLRAGPVPRRPCGTVRPNTLTTAWSTRVVLPRGCASDQLDRRRLPLGAHRLVGAPAGVGREAELPDDR